MFSGMGFCGGSPQPERNICIRVGACLKQRVGSVKQHSDSGCSAVLGRPLGYLIFSLMALVRTLYTGFRGQPRVCRSTNPCSCVGVACLRHFQLLHGKTPQTLNPKPPYRHP